MRKSAVLKASFPLDLCGMCEIGGVIRCHFLRTPESLWGWRENHGRHDEPGAQSCGTVGTSLFGAYSGRQGAGLRLRRRGEHQETSEKIPEGIVKGIDYSPVSVEKARSLNRAAIQEGRCLVWQGSVERIIFAKDWFDAVTAFETVYFWPDLPQCFRRSTGC